MVRNMYCFTYFLVICASVYELGKCTDAFVSFSNSDAAIGLPKEEKLSVVNETALAEGVCNDTVPCENGGVCKRGACECPDDYVGSRCETPAWCAWGKCGVGSEVKCVWDPVKREGECGCKSFYYTYLPKQKKCEACKCAEDGTCLVADDRLVCKCNPNYAYNPRYDLCDNCDCGPNSWKCSFNSKSEKVCQCNKGFAPIFQWPDGLYCQECDCGGNGKCRTDGYRKICDCETGYREFRGRCRECDCGYSGTCELSEFGTKVCSCDYGYAELDGTCQMCDCNYMLDKRFFGVNCSFDFGVKHCSCPPGFEADSIYCRDINECYETNTCPANSVCVNKPGTYECKCREGFRPVNSTADPKLMECEDIDECAGSPCLSPTTRCVNSPGSYDCACREGYYGTSGTYGTSYKPAYNSCYEIETQWREATIALGVILSVGIIAVSLYILTHRRSS